MHFSQALLTLAVASAAVSAGPVRRPHPVRSSQAGTPSQGCKTGDDDGTFDYDALSLREVGARNTLDWRIWLEHKCQPISFWHDVPLYPNASDPSIINVVVEIPRWENGKIEIRRPEPLNPIFHDDRNDAPRFVESVWPHKSYPFVYGSIPQTWESPNVNHSFTNEPGDNDPIDFFDIGQPPSYIGQVKRAKILGALAPNDGGETDWKVLVIDVTDPIAPLVNSWQDVDTYRPGVTAAFRDWFTYYKVARGDEVIPIVGETYQDAGYVVEAVVPRGHAYWRELVGGEGEEGEVDANGVNFNQTSNREWTGSYVKAEEATELFGLPEESRVEEAAEKPEEYEEWYYLDEEFQLVEQGREE